MKTYSLELRHAPSKNRLNALENNRLPPLRLRLEGDVEAVAWARSEAYQFADRNRGFYFQYIEAAVMELLPISAGRGDDYRRLGRWVINQDGVNWRPTPAKSAPPPRPAAKTSITGPAGRKVEVVVRKTFRGAPRMNAR